MGILFQVYHVRELDEEVKLRFINIDIARVAYMVS